MGSLGIAVIAKGGHLYSGPHADMYTVPLYSILSMPDPSIHKGTGVPPVRHCGTGCLRGRRGGEGAVPLASWLSLQRETHTHIAKGTKPTRLQLSEWSWREEKAFSTWSSFHAPKEPLKRLK